MSNKRNSLDLFHSTGFLPHSFFDFDDDMINGMGFRDFRADIRENKDEYVIEAEMPGIEKDDINIDIDDRTLTISAELDEQNDEKDEDGRYIRRERRTGSFRRSFSLDNIKAEDIKAKMKNGVLVIHCPKKSQTISSSRRIEIQ